MQCSQHAPPIYPLLLVPRQHNHIRNQRHTLQHDGEAHQKADRAPHAAEVAITAVAVRFVGEVVAGIGGGGTMLVEAVGVVDVCATGLFRWKKGKGSISQFLIHLEGRVCIGGRLGFGMGGLRTQGVKGVCLL